MSTEKKDFTSNKQLMITAGIIIVLGVVLLIVMITNRVKAKKTGEDSQISQASVSESSRQSARESSSRSSGVMDDPLAGTYETVEDYQNLVIDLRGQIEKLRQEKSEVQSRLESLEANQNGTIFSYISRDLTEGLSLFHNISCNGAYEMLIKRENYVTFINDYLTENAYRNFFEDGEVSLILNGTGQYTHYEVDKETDYNISRRITAIDVMCTEADIENGTATYCIIYKVEEIPPFTDSVNEVWRINYGKCVYNTEKGHWQFDDIYMLKTFTAAPSNEEELTEKIGKQE